MEKKRVKRGVTAHLLSPAKIDRTVCGRDALLAGVHVVNEPLFEQQAAIGKACSTCLRVHEATR